MGKAEHVLGWFGIGLEAVWMAYALLFGSDAGLTVPVLLVLWYGGLALGLLWAVRFIMRLLLRKRVPSPTRMRRLALEGVLVAACFAAVQFGVAFRLRFLLSRPALTRYATAARSSSEHGHGGTGTRVGLFWIRESETLPGGVVRLITTDCMFDDCGVAYSPSGKPPIVGEAIYTPIGGSWWHWWRSW